MPTIMPTAMMLSPVALSNLYTMGVAAQYDIRQAVARDVCLPNEAIRKLRAQLILEEALETIKGLGFELIVRWRGIVDKDDISLTPLCDDARTDAEQVVEIIDGAADLIYVATAALCAVGVPDAPHLFAVCQANDAKFPGGKAIIDPATGKYLKPPGWQAPDHQALIDARAVASQPSLDYISQLLVKRAE